MAAIRKTSLENHCILTSYRRSRGNQFLMTDLGLSNLVDDFVVLRTCNKKAVKKGIIST